MRGGLHARHRPAEHEDRLAAVVAREHVAGPDRPRPRAGEEAREVRRREPAERRSGEERPKQPELLHGLDRALLPRPRGV